MKFKVGQRVQIPKIQNRFWNYCGSDKTATVVKVDAKSDDPFPYLLRLSDGHEVWFMERELVACQRSAQVI